MADTGGERRRDQDTRKSYEIAKMAAESAVREFGPVVIHETLIGLGIPAGDPLAMQERMVYLREATHRANDPDVRADREWTRSNRKRCETVKGAMLSKAGTIVAMAGALVILAGLAHYLGFKMPI